jgi:hypothetical protein
MNDTVFIKYNVPTILTSIELKIGMQGRVTSATNKVTLAVRAENKPAPHYTCVEFKRSILGLPGAGFIQVMVPNGYFVLENNIVSRDPVVDNPPMLIVRAKYPSSPVYVYLDKDIWDRKHNGSLFYWSNNMGLVGGPLKFYTVNEALNKVKRLKIKEQVTDIEVITFTPGVQLVYLDGRVF